MKTPPARRPSWIFAGLSGLLLTAAFPNIGLNWLAWIALVPLLAVIRGLGWKSAFKTGFVAGLVHYLTLIYWVAYTMRAYGNLPWPVCLSILALLAGYLALFPAIFSAFVGWSRLPALASLFVWPALWVAFEYVRTFFLTGFPWGLVGYTQYRSLHLIQNSDILGAYGTSFLILFVNSALCILFVYVRKTDWQGMEVTGSKAAASIFLGAGLTILFWGYGSLRLSALEDRMAKVPAAEVAVVQGNIEQSLKWDPAFQAATIDRYLRLSQSLPAPRPELIVWPETALPFYFTAEPALTEKVYDGLRHFDSIFLLGSPAFERHSGRVDYYNRAFLVEPGGRISGKYDKAHLVPFGEYVPLKRWLPFLGKMVAQVGDFSRGKIGDTIAWQKGPLGVLICYEVIFPYIARSMVANGARLLVNITNDAWYGRSSAPYQHFSMTVFRAVENRRALARSANTGISGFVDPAGRILAETPIFEEAAMSRQLPLMTLTTFYTRFGDVFARLCLAAVLLTAIGRLVADKRAPDR
jgi:apolipoprotein N-acyltransferase